MTDTQIYRLVKQFRSAIENARDDDKFLRDDFDGFPKKCCGDTSCLLAEYLRSKGQESVYVWGEDYTGQTHAWLVVNDERIKKPTPTCIDYPDDIRNVLNSYSNGSYNAPIMVANYEESDISDGLIIDITADQFGKKPIYVDYISDFYRQFEFVSANDFNGLGSSRLRNIYQIILQYIR